MRLFVNGATATVARHAGHPALGRLIQPRKHNDVAQLAAGGLECGADNDALAGVDPIALLDLWRQLAAARPTRLRFCTAPDAVEMTPGGPCGDWSGTLWLWRCWRPALAQLGLPGACLNLVYSVQFFERASDWGTIDHLVLRRHDGGVAFPWSDLQRIKDELCGAERVAVEVFPPQSQLVDDANCRHLWALPAGYALPFGLHLEGWKS